MLMSPDDTAVYMMQLPIELALTVGLLLEGLEDLLPKTVSLPTVEAP
jgi:hypothetical protein